MSKKIILSSFLSIGLISSLVFGVSAYSNKKIETDSAQKNHSTQQILSSLPIVNGSGSYLSFNTIEDMKKNADLVAIIKPTEPFEKREHTTTYLTGPQGEKYVDYFYTMTNVKVKKILYQNPTFDKVKKNELTDLNVAENVSIFIDNDKKKKIVTFDGYDIMDEKQEYLAFLKQNKYGNYYIVNVTNGYFPIDENIPNDEKERQHFKELTFKHFEKELKEYKN